MAYYPNEFEFDGFEESLNSVSNDCRILSDVGFRRGSEIVIALALGSSGVL